MPIDNEIYDRIGQSWWVDILPRLKAGDSSYPRPAKPKFPLISLWSARRLCRDLVNCDLTHNAA